MSKVNKKLFIFAGSFFVFSLFFGELTTFATIRRTLCPVDVSYFMTIDNDCISNHSSVYQELYVTESGNLCNGGGSNNQIVVTDGGIVQASGGGHNTVYLKSGSTFDAGGSTDHVIRAERGATIVDAGAGSTIIYCQQIVITNTPSSANNDAYCDGDDALATSLGCSY